MNFYYLRLCLRLLSGAFLFLFLTYIKAKIAAAKLITSMDIKVDPMLIGFDFSTAFLDATVFTSSKLALGSAKPLRYCLFEILSFNFLFLKSQMNFGL